MSEKPIGGGMTDTKIPLMAGDVFEVPYPFVREKFSYYRGEDDCGEILSWRPGIEMVPCLDDADAVADAIGKQSLAVISTHKPGKFPLRVFYTRTWVDPDGKAFGKTACRVTTIQAFRGLLNGYRHQFEMRTKAIADAPR